MIHQKPQLSPLIGLFIGVLAVSAASILIRFAQKEAPSLVIASYRLILATILLLPIAIVQNRRELKLINDRTKIYLILSGTFLAIHFATWVTSLEYTSVISSVVLVTTSPLWVAIFSLFVFHKRETKYLYIGLVIALLGSILISSGQLCSIDSGKLGCPKLFHITESRAFTGNILALVGALTAAGYIIIGKILRPHISLVTYTFCVYGIGGLILSFLVLITGQKSSGFSLPIYLSLLALAVIPQLIGHTSFNWALRYLSATYVTIATLGEPVGSTILAFLLLDEIPQVIEIVGGVIVLIGIYIASSNEGILGKKIIEGS